MRDKIILFSKESFAEETETVLGSAVTRVKKYHDAEGVHTGFWECFPGSFTIEAHAADEVCHILEGEGAITHADGTVCNIKAGDSFFIPRGTYMTWTVEAYLKKVYMVSQ
ncbi:MAG: cupin domain-containing protein [Desulfobacter sp.]